MTSATMTLRLDNQLKARLEQLATSTHRSKSFLASAAIHDYLNAQEWQINEIKKGVAEAQAGALIDHQKIVRYWEKKRADSMDKGR